MRAFAEACEAIAATTKRGEKLAIAAEHLRARSLEDAGLAALFLSGRAFPAHEDTTLQVGGALLSRTLVAAAGASDVELAAAYRRHGDIGDVAEELLAAPTRAVDDPSLRDVDAALRAIAAARTVAEKSNVLLALLARSSPPAAKYILKVITADLRIGVKEALVEEAIAKAFGVPFTEVQRANMMLGDIRAALALAAEGRLAEARMHLFHPIDVMLAVPAASSEEAFASFEDAIVEDKFDGIRAQAHVAEGASPRFFSRTRDEVTASFPELVDAVAELPGELVLDGEIVAWREGEGALPFGELQKRLGRKVVDDRTMREVPVAYVVFDVISRDGALLVDEPLEERERHLDAIFAGRRSIARRARPGQLSLFDAALAAVPPPAALVRSALARAHSAAEVEALFDAARARGNEGLMIKDARSPYRPGRRGKSWLKLKRELATLDVVVTGVEFGHGKRTKVLSDYTFAVRAGDRLLDIGKAYTGLTDAEIAEYTRFFFEHTREDQGWFRTVEPVVVIEVAFNAVMRSDRHPSGYALRFPRIVRIRADKTPRDANTLDDVRAIFEAQNARPPAPA